MYSGNGRHRASGGGSAARGGTAQGNGGNDGRVVIIGGRKGTSGMSGNGGNGNKNNKKRVVKLTALGATLLFVYLAFVYLVFVTFDPPSVRSKTTTSMDAERMRDSRASVRAAKVQSVGGGDGVADGKGGGVTGGGSENVRPPQSQNSTTTAAANNPTPGDFCGLCRWKDQPFNCNERVEWVVNQKGSTIDEARKTNLEHCTSPPSEVGGCSSDKLDDVGFLSCPTRPFVPSIENFCGLCRYRDSNFNCNERVAWLVSQRKAWDLNDAKVMDLRHCAHASGCGDAVDDAGYMTNCAVVAPVEKPIPYAAGTAAHVEKEPELEAVLTGALLLDVAQNNAYDVEELSRKRRKEEKAGDDGSALRPWSVSGRSEEGMRDRRTGEDILQSVLVAVRYGDRSYDQEEGGGGDDGEEEEGDGDGSDAGSAAASEGGRTAEMPVLTAYCEPVNQTAWETKPLPMRDGSRTRGTLFEVKYPRVNSCAALPSQWPIDTPPVDLDPFLPWIHDVFPSHDGKDVVFVAQNRRRCYNGQRFLRRGESPPKGVIPHKQYIHLDYKKNYFMRPQAALFQHVPVKRVPSEEEDPGGRDHPEPRYRLASHEDADDDGLETRFVCRFKSFDPDASPSLSIVGYSLSRHAVDYDYHTYRKGYKFSATEAGYDNHMIWQSQLLFNCPVPEEYREMVQRGDTVVNDYATFYVDLVPIRTAPRYTPPREFLQPRHDFQNELDNLFVPDIEWGKEHVLPRIDESGRWENIPICMPSLMTQGIVPKGVDVSSRTIPENAADSKYVSVTGELPPKIHKVIACTWAATTFRTRSNRAQVSDGKRRLQEWLEFNLLSGFDHIYVYDNSGAFTNEDSLEDITDLFPPDKVTRVNWPCKICSNRDGNEGERSSQYAAESSCRLRFGTHARWLGSFDTDEYLVPMGDFKSMGEVADYMDTKDTKVAVFKSSPAKPRFDLLEDPPDGYGTFKPTVTADETFLHTYNCNWEPFPRKNDLSHRRKQMYRADYVKLHYVHYSTITVVSQMTEKQTKSLGESWLHRYVERHLHEFDEIKESTMLHTKTKVAQQMGSWNRKCKTSAIAEAHCHVGFPFPAEVTQEAIESARRPKLGNREDGYGYNCFINEKIENYWWPKLIEAIEMRKINAAPD